jgi:alpha-glucosidase
MSFDSHWVHHDGSELYVSNPAPQFEEQVRLRLRTSKDFAPENIFIRTTHDGEPKVIYATLESEGNVEKWWYADLPIRNRRTHYRWGFAGGNVSYGWLNAEGWMDHDVTDAHDFAITVAPLVPKWNSSAVVYQVYPDRFAKSDKEKPVPDWAVPRNWEQRPEGRSKNTPREWFGGDFWGAAERLDHVQSLGANVVYFTPFFPAQSTHRYDANTFASVDPLLGGDEAFIKFIEAAHALDMKVVGDITLNHSGVAHEWFEKAMEGNPHYSSFYTFGPQYEYGYLCWLEVRSLPKFNYHSSDLKEELITGHDSIIRKWLRAPFGMDGWRVDVANMTGRQGELDANHEVARLTRNAMAEEGDDKVLIAEHFHDAGPDLDGDGWHGTMNYSAFMKPVWQWLVSKDFGETYLGLPMAVPSITGKQMAKTIRNFASRMPWRSYTASWALLGSHDTARIRTVVGTDERQQVAATLLMTLPGVPMIFSGDEIGSTGYWGEDSRTAFPWHAPESWNQTTLQTYQSLIELRKTNSALIDGGLRWIATENDVVVYLRESKQESLLIVVARDAAELNVDLSVIDFTGAELVQGSNSEVVGKHLNWKSAEAGYAIWRLR